MNHPTPCVALVLGASLLAACGRQEPSAPSAATAPAKVSAPSPAPLLKKQALSSLVRGGNTEVAWSCRMQVPWWGDPRDRREEVGEGWFSEVEGFLEWDPVQERVTALEWSVAVASCQADRDRGWRYSSNEHRQWFDASHFPRASFKAQRVTQRENGKMSWIDDGTHLIHGLLTVNGVEKEVEVPGKIVFGKEGVRVEASLTILRQQFKMGPRQGGDMAEQVWLSFRVDPTPAVAQLAQRAQSQRGEIRQLKKELAWSQFRQREDREEWTDRLTKAEASVAYLRQAAALQLCAQALPAKFEDALVYPGFEKDYEEADVWHGSAHKRHYSYAGHRAPFTMVLVPGDLAKGIAPFYIGETEVSWDLFQHWSHWYDAPPFECRKEVDAGLRPTNADSYSDTSHNDKRYAGYPALGMSRLAAERFCTFLSKRTGRHYRLPTEAEWERAHALGGGDPATDEAKKAVAWCKENAELTPEGYEDAPGLIKVKKPNKLGLYDMLGNVAEWVQTPGIPDRDGKNTFVRGGDFKTPAAQLSGKRREESDNRRNIEGSWNATYPNDPPTKWWYKDHYQVGFRLVCDPVNLPSAKP